MSQLIRKEFQRRTVLDSALAEKVAEILSTGVEERGRAVLVVSGGSTPLQFFRLLSKKPIAWPKVSITLADERWVDPAHEDSNENLVRKNLLINEAKSASFLALKSPCAEPEAGQAALDRALKALGEFDVVVLGMGVDGHTASLFPQSLALAQGLDMRSDKSAIAVDPVTAPYRRMSMTLPRLLKTRNLIIHITGEEKRQVFERASTGQTAANYPISAVLQQNRVPVSLYWAE